MTMIRFVPRLLMDDCTAVCAPLPIATMMMTAPTPITMPSIVSIVRILFLRMLCPAILSKVVFFMRPSTCAGQEQHADHVKHADHADQPPDHADQILPDHADPSLPDRADPSLPDRADPSLRPPSSHPRNPRSYPRDPR